MTLTDDEVQKGVMIVALEVARGRMNEALKTAQYATNNANKATAEVARLQLLKLAGDIPGMNGMTFETQYEYDDEGGYFESLSCYPTFEDDEAADYDQWDFIDTMNSFGADPIRVLCGAPEATIGQITLEQAREARF